jgi:hypothetical protein
MDITKLVEQSLRTVLGSDLCDFLSDGFRRGLASEEDHRCFFVERATAAAAARLARDSPTVLYWMVRDGVLPTETISVCALPDEAEAGAEMVIAGPTPVPRKPFVRELARRLVAWAERNAFPLTFPAMPLLEEVRTAEEGDFCALTPQVSAFVAAGAADVSLAAGLLRALGERGIRTLLGLRTTRGSLGDALPPGVGEMVASFRTRHSLDSAAMLTVGARALAKHCRRAADGWWGDGLAGTEREKNARAERVLARILADAAWLNIHTLPHGVYVYEVRNTEGFGARWCCAPPYEFRGFLEPQMTDGHEKGWVH